MTVCARELCKVAPTADGLVKKEHRVVSDTSLRCGVLPANAKSKNGPVSVRSLARDRRQQ